MPREFATNLCDWVNLYVKKFRQPHLLSVLSLRLMDAVYLIWSRIANRYAYIGEVNQDGEHEID